MDRRWRVVGPESLEKLENAPECRGEKQRGKEIGDQKNNRKLCREGNRKGTHKSGNEGNSRLLDSKKHDHDRAAEKAEEILKAHQPEPFTAQPRGKEHAQADRAKIGPIEHQHGRFQIKHAVRRKGDDEHGGPGVGLQKHRDKHAREKGEAERGEREGHRAPKPFSILQRSGAGAHFLETEKNEAHAEKRARKRLPERDAESSQGDSGAAHEVGDDGMDVQRGHERERREADIGPYNDGRRGPRLDKSAVGEADQNERHGCRALHDGASKSPQPCSKQRRMRRSFDDVAETRSVKPAQILSDETQPRKNSPKPRIRELAGVILSKHLNSGRS